MRILIAEDEAISRRTLESILSSWGHEVIVTSDGNEALAVLQSPHAPPLAILDVRMPGIDGIKVCQKLREKTQGSRPYIILLTADNRKQGLVTGLQAGADDYVHKPFDRDELQARVQAGVRVVETQRTLAARVRRLERAEEELRSLSLTDELTGLWNRRGFLIHVDQYIKASSRTGKSSLLFFADMDGLKQINDTFGHHEGSQAIIRVARVLTKTFRKSDIIARLGGDEFVILVADVSSKHAKSIGVRLSANLKSDNAQGLSNYEISLSHGFVCVEPDTSNSIEKLITLADQEMYNHKRERRRLVRSEIYRESANSKWFSGQEAKVGVLDMKTSLIVNQ